MQYKKLGFNRLFKGCSSYQVSCILTDNRSELPNFSYRRPLCLMLRKPKAYQMTGKMIKFVN